MLQEKDKTLLKKTFEAVSAEAEQIRKDVVRDAIDLKEEFIKYSKNRLVSGGALAFKFGVLGTLVGPIGTKTAAVAGFAIGFFGGPAVARKLEQALGRKEDTADDNPPPKDDGPGADAGEAPPSPAPPRIEL